jgi:predicted DNA-binding protein
MPQVRLQEETYERLDDLRATGQSFDGIVRELLDGEADD